MSRRTHRRKVWFHRATALFFAALIVPGVLWWAESILFVILISLVTQTYTAWAAAEAADDRELADRLDRIERYLRGPNAGEGP